MRQPLVCVTLSLLAGGLLGGCQSSQQVRAEQEAELHTYEAREAILAWDGDYVFDQITEGDDAEVLRRIRYWCVYHENAMIPRLIELVDDPTAVGLRGDAELAGDLSTVAGRASWYLTSLTGREFGTVGAQPSAEDLVALQTRWDDWWTENRRWWWD